MIEIKDITKTYNTGDISFQALGGVSFTIKDGEFVAIMGPSGSGKSTLMHILGALDTPTSGTYFLDGKEKEYIIEPSPKEVLEELAPKLLKIRLYHAILEANASEHSARRVAMKNASDNASELSGELTMVYNKSRQAAITNQIIEITSGAQALE